MFNDKKKEIVFDAIAEYSGLPLKLILGHERVKELVKARSILCYYLREKENMSYPLIGRLIKKHHSGAIRLVGFGKTRNLKEAKLFCEWVAIDLRKAGLN